MKKIAAFFDFDGTLFQGHFWQGVVKHDIKHKRNPAAVFNYMSTHIPLWLASKFNFLSEQDYKVSWGEDLANLFKNINKDDGNKIFEWIINNYFMKLLRPNVMALLQQHKSDGHTTVLLSGSFSDFLETVKQKLGIDYAVGTELEIIENRYTGKVVKPLCFGTNKAKLLHKFASQAHLNIDLNLSFAYADSIFDAPVLEMVGNPAAVYPDKKLFSLAQQRGWQIINSPVSGPAKNSTRK